MAGKYRRSDPGETFRYGLRLPVALKAHLEDVALEHGHSLNEEIIERLMQPSFRKYSKETWAKLMALEPGPDNTRTAQEIAAEISRVKGEKPFVPSADDFDDVAIDWISGSEGPLWNDTHGDESKSVEPKK